MNIVRVNPIFQGRSFSDMIDDIFNRGMSDINTSNLSTTVPSVNITDNNDHVTLEVAAPGMDKKDFNISLDKDQLTISVEKEANSEEKEEGKWTRKEFSYSSFKRSFHLGEDIRTDSIEANYENGILKLILPKKEASKDKLPKSIEVK
ncbi:MAG TPA: Hsp20/alpha crystallin family protein [Saprospiraceae bacterium]|jgi:HSP20 family protein|nr:Hsp20/alpha crystallin family protein [Saprospiraceae bacterium]HRO09348.1 Hsp20/alpha crystallin family protein [Saprospiraceae bacterium]HRO72885.1 Hsp20/alpha crystallin family protein [Saprospiraceae bacterium]HRP42677.1 Hsp20/alpha crystallin family protein [Saprospiraceae bacterium]